MRRHSVLITSLLAILPACSSSRSQAPARSLPHAGSTTPPQQRAAEAVPLPDPGDGKPVSLAALLAYADEHAPAVRLGKARRGRGEAARQAVSAWLPDDPQLTVGAARRRVDGESGNDFQVSLEQRFDIAGQRGLRLDAADRLDRQLEAGLAETRWRVHETVHRAFHAALVARARVASATRVAEFNRRMVEIAQKRATAGDIPRLHVRLAEGELALAVEQKIQAEQDELASRLTLAELSGWPVASPPITAGQLDVPRDAPASAGLIERALSAHPALRTLDAAVEEAAARKTLADREAAPDVTVGLSLTREAIPGTSDHEQIAGLTLGVPLPLWQRNRSERALAGADVREAGAEADAIRGSIAARVTRTATAVTAGAARIRAYGTEIIPRFEENIRLLTRAFELGEVDVLQALVARERFLQIERDALVAYSDYYEAVADLESELGQELWPDDHHDDGGPR